MSLDIGRYFKTSQIAAWPALRWMQKMDMLPQGHQSQGSVSDEFGELDFTEIKQGS